MLVLIDGNRVDTDRLSVGEMTFLLNQIEGDADRIDTDLTMARAKKYETGEFADPAWYARATIALKHKRRQVQSLKEIIAQKRRSERRFQAAQEKPLSDYFMEICRVRMADDVFQAIYQAALRLKMDAPKGAPVPIKDEEA